MTDQKKPSDEELRGALWDAIMEYATAREMRGPGQQIEIDEVNRCIDGLVEKAREEQRDRIVDIGTERDRVRRYPDEERKVRMNDQKKPKAWTAWLIERRRGGEIHYASFVQGFVEWTEDALRACQFVRREDAEQMAYSEDCDAIIEHQFGFSDEMPVPRAVVDALVEKAREEEREKYIPALDLMHRGFVLMADRIDPDSLDLEAARLILAAEKYDGVCDLAMDFVEARIQKAREEEREKHGVSAGLARLNASAKRNLSLTANVERLRAAVLAARQNLRHLRGCAVAMAHTASEDPDCDCGADAAADALDAALAETEDRDGV